MRQPLLELLTARARELVEHTEAALRDASIAGFFVGGTVRDALLGFPVTDPDIVVDGDAQELGMLIATRAGGVFVPLDPLRGIVRVVVELSGGHQSHVDIARLVGSNMDTDLRRRDFTANALAVPLHAGRLPDWRTYIVDPLGGMRDIQRRRLRLVSPTALVDDPARILRAVRIAAQRKLEIDGDLKAALVRSRSLLNNVAGDRLRDELLLLLETPDPADTLHALDARGLLMTLIPEMKPMRGCRQPPEHYWDVLEHSIQAVGFAHRLLERKGLAPETLAPVPWGDSLAGRFEAPFAHNRPRSSFLKLAALFHDIGKPAAKSLDAYGRVRFFGHSEMGATTVETIMARLRFSKKAIQHISLMVTEHLRPAQMGPKGQLPSRRARWRYHRDLGDAAVDTLFLSLADYLAARGPNLDFPRWEERVRMHSSVLSHDSSPTQTKSTRLINGHDLMRRFGLPPGPALGRLLRRLEEATGSGEVTTREEAFELARTLITINHSAGPPRISRAGPDKS